MELLYDYDNGTLTLTTGISHLFDIEDVVSLRIELTSHTNMEDTYVFNVPVGLEATVTVPADIYTAQMIYTLDNGETINELEIIVTIPPIPENDVLRNVIVRMLENVDPTLISYEEMVELIRFLKTY